MTTAALRGQDLALYIGNGASPEVFTKLAACKTLKHDFSRTTVDVTNKDSAGFQEMLGTASVASIKLSVDAYYCNAATQATMRSLATSGAVNNFKVMDGAGNYSICGFIVTAVSRSGGYNDAEAISYTLESTGVPTYVAGS